MPFGCCGLFVAAREMDRQDYDPDHLGLSSKIAHLKLA
jgi:hypothetical protein